MAGLEALRQANSSAKKSVKFVYLSGHGISQDFTTKPLIMGEYRTMRVSRASPTEPLRFSPERVSDP